MSTLRLTDDQKAHVRALAINGSLVVDAVVADAKRTESPLHGLFNWDVQKAAEEHWRDRAREIVRAVTVSVTTQSYVIHVPFFVRDQMIGREPGYITLERLQRDPSASRTELVAELEQVAGRLRRAVGIARALGLEDSIEELIAQILGLRAVVHQPLDSADPPAEQLTQ